MKEIRNKIRNAVTKFTVAKGHAEMKSSNAVAIGVSSYSSLIDNR